MENRIFEKIDQIENDFVDDHLIYKYHEINQFAYDIIINSELNFKNPFMFNDPFDCNLTIDANNTPEQIKHYYQIANWKKSAENDPEIQQLIATNFTDQVAFKRKINSISKQVISKLGLSCFTQTKDNLLMWAHYTKDHKGMCLEFDYLLDPVFFKPLKKVVYDKCYPVYNYYNDKNNVVGQLMLHKSHHWAYEQEIRIIKKEQGVHPFNPISMRKIYFGVKTPAKQIETLKKLVRNSNKYKHVQLFNARLDETNYQLNFEHIN
jgi:hypothetical protein